MFVFHFTYQSRRRSVDLGVEQKSGSENHCFRSLLPSSFKQKRRLNSPTYHQQLPQFFSTPSQESQSCRRRFRVRATFRITSVRHNHEVSACSVDTYIHICCMLFERRGKKCPISDFCQERPGDSDSLQYRSSLFRVSLLCLLLGAYFSIALRSVN